MSKEVRIIVSEWLVANGYDGLVNVDGECGCPVGDLMPCENSIAGLGDCEPAYQFRCSRCRKYCDNLPIYMKSDALCDEQNPDYSELFATKKDFCEPDYMECRNVDEISRAKLADLFGILADGGKQTGPDELGV